GRAGARPWTGASRRRRRGGRAVWRRPHTLRENPGAPRRGTSAGTLRPSDGGGRYWPGGAWVRPAAASASSVREDADTRVPPPLRRRRACALSPAGGRERPDPP